jgi:hypothetical protein
VRVALAFALTTGGLLSPLRVNAQVNRKPVIISFGQPNIWSLEQAHYLLARMHERSLDLASRTPDDEDLDPNATNGTRLSTLKTLLEAGVSFDQGIGSQNQLLAQANQHTFERRRALEARKDQRMLDLQRVGGELAGLNFEREQMNANGATDAEKKLKDTEIKSKTAEQASLNTEITNIDTELGKNPAPTGTPTSVAAPTPFDKSKFTDSVVDKMLASDDFKKELRNDVRLAATTMLDNHIQMQYEIIAKQLTLLRDEVGPNERLVFLELPQSLYTTPGKSEEMVAQVWWKVTTATPLDEPPRIRTKELVRQYQQELSAQSAKLDNQRQEKKLVDQDIDEARKNRRPIPPQLNARSAELTADIIDTEQRLTSFTERLNEAIIQQGQQTAERIRDDRRKTSITNPVELAKKVRTVDLIPRQSSLNVNDIQDTVKSGAFTAAFSFLFGLGGKVTYQRQRELYEQYIHQDIFASSFGKGTGEFGWTFGPLPGTKRIAPGIRTTYAVMVIPKNVKDLSFVTSGCYFSRKRNAPASFAETSLTDWQKSNSYRCDTASAPYVVTIPDAREDGFYVNGVRYKKGVKAGQRVAVSLYGRDFSAQTGILVDGVSLRPSVGVAQPLLAARRDGAAFGAVNGISGEFERLNANQLVLTFSMPEGYTGTPTITVVAPGRAVDINNLYLEVNGVPNQQLDGAPFMFGKRPQDELTLSALDLFRKDSKSKRAFAVLSGVKLPAKFDPAKVDLRVNGVPAVPEDKTGDKPVEVLDDGADFYRLEFDLPDSDTIDVSIISDGEYATQSFPNPLRLRISEASVVAFDGKGKEAVLTLRLKGTGFGNSPEITVQGVTKPNVIPINSGEAAVEVKNPPALIVITVTNSDSKASATTFVTRPPGKKEE